MGAGTAVIPIFPLSDVVLFPHVRKPFHLFEPRYRQMAEHVLAGDKQIGMIAVPPEHVDAMEGDPPVYPVGCIGAIVGARQRDDGRYDVVVHGTHRFRIENEVERPEDRLYRVAEVALLEDTNDPADAEALAALRVRLVELLTDPAQLSGTGSGKDASHELLRELDDGIFVNSLSDALRLPTPEKQGLLEADGIRKRLERLEGLLSFHRARLQIPGQPGDDRLH
jgi:Lon protease-like protein